MNVAGAPSSRAGSYTLARIAACGHTIAHLLHWMHSAASHTGISRAMLRFSHCVVATGQVPSTGNAETGSRSPLPDIITAVTRLTKSGAASETVGGIGRVAVTVPGTFTSNRWARVWSTAAKFFCTTTSPFLP